MQWLRIIHRLLPVSVSKSKGSLDFGRIVEEKNENVGADYCLTGGLFVSLRIFCLISGKGSINEKFLNVIFCRNLGHSHIPAC